MTIEQIKLFNVNINVEDIIDDGEHMCIDTYQDQIKPYLVSSEPIQGQAIEDLETLTVKVIKRTNKWVQWMLGSRKRSRKHTPQQAPIVKLMSSSIIYGQRTSSTNRWR